VYRLKLDLAGFIAIRLDPVKFVPSPGQGALAIEMRSNDSNKSRIFNLLHHNATSHATVIERALLRRFGGGCSLPLGAWAEFSTEVWTLKAFWGGANEPRWTSQDGSDENELVDRTFNALSR
jgi:porphobilinogen deaminase